MPLAPYEFFFIDYEWSGEKHELHWFDWLYQSAIGCRWGRRQRRLLRLADSVVILVVRDGHS